MGKLRLLAVESLIYEGMKSGKSISQIYKELNETSGKVYHWVQRLVELGAVTRTGSKAKSYVYTVVDQPYEVVISRKAKVDSPESIEDKLIDEMVGISLNELQKRFALDNRDSLSRLDMAKKLGITKLQLNHWMNANAPKRKASPVDGLGT